MTLFDVDKNNQDRNAPRPNSKDVLTNRPNYGTLSTQYQTTPQSSTTGYVKMNNQNLIVNDGSTNRALVGYNKNTGTWGFYAVTAGNDVTTATSYALDSDYDQFKIVLKKTATFSLTSTTGGAASTSVAISHSLGYVPLTMSSVNITSDWNGNSGIFPLPYFIPATISSYAGFQLASYVRVNAVNTTQVSYSIGELAGGTTIAGTITAYFLQETAT